MAMISRAGTGLLLAGGLLLAMLMGYTLSLDPSLSRSLTAVSPDGAADVAVFYPGHADWLEFRQGIAACVRRDLARVVQEGDATVVLKTSRHGRLVRFSWHGTRGLVETRDEVRLLAARAAPPVAVVGSTNTVLTVALAEALRAAPEADTGGPVLLVPWATSVLVDRPEHGAGPVALLDILPGRTFRLCPNNQGEADLVVRCLTDHEPAATPARAVIVVDRNDPYSVDLAGCFRRAIEKVAPHVEIIERADALSAPGPGGLDAVPGPSERQQAESIWRAATEAPPGRATWVVLPLQGRPSRRMLAALRDLARYAPGPADERLRILCGDGIGLETLSELAGSGLDVPVWCVSSASIPLSGRTTDAEEATQIQAEVVSALLLVLDRPGGAGADLRQALATLALSAEDPGAMARSLAFTPSGERRGDDLGHVLTIRPGRAEILAYARGGDGRWGEAVSLPLVPVSARR